jgi:tetratricopeptide (TPR) repeat protein
MPEATIKFGSPNSCNICHKDKTPQWANSIVKKRTNRNYQDETIRWGTLLSNARTGKWDRFNEMTGIIEKEEHNEVVIASYVRTLENLSNEKKLPVLFNALKSKSPLVRSSAASALSGSFSTETAKALLEACSDEFRVVRAAAAASLAEFPKNLLSVADSLPLANATREYIRSLNVRLDDWSSHYNIAIYYQGQGDNAKALDSYETAVRLYPEALLPLINSSVLYSALGNQAKAIENLRKAIAVDSVNEAANLNYGLVMAEQGRMEEAEKALKIALSTNPKQAVAAYNLSVITSSRNLNEAIGFARIAARSLPEEPKYGYTLAFYLLQNKQKVEAVKTLRDVISRQPLYLDAYKLLADINLRDGKRDEAVKVYRMALETKGIHESDKIALQQIVNSLNKSN